MFFRVAKKIILILSAIMLTFTFAPVIGQKQAKPKDANAADIPEKMSWYGKDLYMIAGIDYRYDNKANNSDTMIIVQVDHTDKSIKLISVYRDTYLNVYDDYYFKANAAYNKNGAKGMLSMVKKNLDLDIEKYVTVNFVAVQKAVDAYGGLDIEVTKEEAEWLNKFNRESATACKVAYAAVPEEDGTYHLDGSQALSYARIRYTEGADFKRTERQRIVISKLFEKAKKEGPAKLVDAIRDIYPETETNVGFSETIKLAKAIVTYNISQSEGFPYEKSTGMAGRASVVFADDLESNVLKLHQVLGDMNYVVPESVREISNRIEVMR